MASRMTEFKDKSVPTHTCNICRHTHICIQTHMCRHTPVIFVNRWTKFSSYLHLFIPAGHTHTLKLSPLQCCRENSHFKATVVLLLQLRLGQLKDLQFSKQSNALQAHVFKRQARSGPDPLSSQSYTLWYLCFQNIYLVFIIQARKIHIYLHYLVVHWQILNTPIQTASVLSKS